ncbi:uncharacterized protein LOC125025866 [Penaeus chinensis]|uniref:uncharacterized protein LOC125025866 n=1 Tax=Penaeus chinensis TaxID=139456 RepID=UPI001FB7431C|nr:uncharacterized protein LOC125025866 [Penaeus chinensis]
MDIKYSTHITASLILFIAITYNLVGGLHITKVQVPTPLTVGEGGWLECDWADGENIYALKWYLGLDEFYRWTPAENPPVKTFKVRGEPLKVDIEASHKGRVRVDKVTLDAAGVFRCEVSAEGPDFHTESHVASMTVVDLPDGKPLITGLQEKYQPHDEVNLNCTSINSQPMAELAFFVNGKPAEKSWLIHQKTPEEPVTGLQTAWLGLRFSLWPGYFRRGVVRVTCTASILEVYNDSSEAIVKGDLPHHASIMEGRASDSAGCAETSRNLLLLLASHLLLLH